ncbi:MAG: hypothetical protein EXR79_16000 [Myxococcales bacterium]|nr:hypothetical protein [Myxococcales bacterium]
MGHPDAKVSEVVEEVTPVATSGAVAGSMTTAAANDMRRSTGPIGLPGQPNYRLNVRSRLQGTARSTMIDRRMLSGADFKLLRTRIAEVEATLGPAPYALVRDGQRHEVEDFEELLDRVLDFGMKGVQLNRFKGLGEMNPEQLWETTMDPTARVLLQVKVEDAVSADQVFTVLMGDEVEPRRDFITRNALNVRNLDL